jgi:hypothetical protein
VVRIKKPLLSGKAESCEDYPAYDNKGFLTSIYIKLLANTNIPRVFAGLDSIIGHYRPLVKIGLWKLLTPSCYNSPMNEFMLAASFIALLAVIVFFVFMMERQTKNANQMISFLVAQFRDISTNASDTHQRQLDTLVTMNLGQADRHRQQVESLLGLIDELSANANPGKITAQQYKEYQRYLIDEAQKAG